MDDRLSDTGAPHDKRSGKRGWFQIHLLTAVALMIVAGVLLGANLAHGSDEFGWPFTFLNGNGPNGAKTWYWDHFSYSWLVYDGIVFLLCITMTGFIFEARTWGWSRGKIFVWAFIGAALSLQILNHLFQLMAESTGLFMRPH